MTPFQKLKKKHWSRDPFFSRLGLECLRSRLGLEGYRSRIRD